MTDELIRLDRRVAGAVTRRRRGDPKPDDPFRGLYISDDQVDGDLAAGGRIASALDGRRLLRLRASFDLDADDIDLLVVALAPDLDPRFERLYGYLQDDVSRRRASIGLALELCFGAGAAAAGLLRSRLGPDGPLRRGGLVLVEEPERPFLTRPLRVPDRVAAHLLGEDTASPAIAPLLATPRRSTAGGSPLLAVGLAAGSPLAYVRQPVGAAGVALAAGALLDSGREPVVLDLRRLVGDEAAGVAAAAVLEARLRDGGIVAFPVEALVERGRAAIRAFTEADCPVVLVGSRGWDPRWSSRPALVVEAPALDVSQRSFLWSSAVPGADAGALSAFRLGPDEVDRAVQAATARAAAEGRSVATADLQAGARAQNAAGLETLARRLEPRVGWDDLVVAPRVHAQLTELADRGRHREQVLGEWGLGSATAAGRGVTALFAGESGTGKTLSAQVVAADLGLDLYVVDLSGVIDKYVGETEKNLDRIFDEADRVNGVLLFDEADALFGRRSEVRDAQDRYANVEVAYLLSRMERFDGLAILTTNLRANLDEAFIRRLDAVVDFPLPDEGERRRLWELHLRPGVPRTADIDLDFLATAFRIPGGNIAGITLTAGYRAAAAGRAVGMADLIAGTEREYRKLGRLCVESDFGPYYPLVGAANWNGARV
jgi:hypothetical protein